MSEVKQIKVHFSDGSIMVIDDCHDVKNFNWKKAIAIEVRETMTREEFEKEYINDTMD